MIFAYMLFIFFSEFDEYFHGKESSINKYLIVLLPVNNVVVTKPTIGNNRAVFLPVGKGGKEVKESFKNLCY